MRKIRPVTVVAEISAMTALMLSYIWIWEDSFRYGLWVCIALYVAIGVESHVRRGETAREIGFRTDNLGPALLQVVIWIGPLIVLAFAAGLVLDSIHFSGSSRWPLHIVRRIVFGTVQQYGLLCFFYRRFGEILPGSASPMVAAAVWFALFHFPNPSLTVLTLGLGLLSIRIYRRVPNVWALGLGHGLLSTAVSRALPPELTGGMRVGPGLREFMGNLEAATISLWL
jgi:hypothetical protein